MTTEEFGRTLTIMDDEFSQIFLDGQNDCIEYMLKHIIGKDLKVEKCELQKKFENLEGHSSTFDIYAKDKNGVHYNIELQNGTEGASVRRARYHSSLMDIKYFEKNTDYKTLFDTFVIFITSFDPFNLGASLYRYDRSVTSDKGLKEIDDGAHVIYVNGTIKTDKSDLGKLIHNLNCYDPEEMYDSPLKDRMVYLRSEEGAKIMSEKMRKFLEEKTKETAAKLISKGVSLEVVSECTELTADQVLEIKESLQLK